MKSIKIILIITCVFVLGVFAQNKTNKTNKTTEKTKTSIPGIPPKSDLKTNETEKVIEVESDEPIVRNINNINNTDLTVSDIDSTVVAAVGTKRNNEKYRIGFQDILTITVYKHPELSQTVSVGQDGTILLPRIDEPIVAVCKTERQLASLVTQLYKNYLRNPFVNVSTQEQRSQPFAVIGAVNKPGSFFLNQRIRLLSLLSMAGGQDVEKNGSRIQVARLGNLSACNPTDDSDGEVEFFAYSLNDVITGRENPWMEPGDIVSVLEAEEAYVIGEVFEPAKITLKQPITLTEALAYAGGLSDTAKTSKVIIQRKEKNSQIRNELVFDLKEIKERKVPDPILQGNDIVVVTSSTGKKFKKGFWDLIIKGLPNIFYKLPI